MFSTFSSDKGFTLVETLVAITLLALAVVGPMTIAQQGLRGAVFAKDELTASSLGQEGIELIRAQRDEYYLAGSLTGADDPNWMLGISGMSTCMSANGCTVDMTSPTTPAAGCPSQCDVLKYQASTGLYGYGAGWVDTQFRRTIKLTSSNSTQYYLITVTMSWRSGTIDRVLTLREPIQNWQSEI